jgi:hypothetical protein
MLRGVMVARLYNGHQQELSCKGKDCAYFSHEGNYLTGRAIDVIRTQLGFQMVGQVVKTKRALAVAA